MILQVIEELVEDLEDTPDLIEIKRVFDNCPFACIVISEINKNGDVEFKKIFGNIEQITGYSNEEFCTKTLEDISYYPINNQKMNNVLDNLKKYKVAQKKNTVKHKNGHPVKVMGVIFKTGKNYTELLFKDDIIVDTDGN